MIDYWKAVKVKTDNDLQVNISPNIAACKKKEKPRENIHII